MSRRRAILCHSSLVIGPARGRPAAGCAELSPLSPLTQPQRQHGPSGSFHGPGSTGLVLSALVLQQRAPFKSTSVWDGGGQRGAWGPFHLLAVEKDGLREAAQPCERVRRWRLEKGLCQPNPSPRRNSWSPLGLSDPQLLHLKLGMRSTPTS